MDPWRKAQLDAVVILSRLYMQVSEPHEPHNLAQGWGCTSLVHAIRHLAYPDRDVYPKVRHGSKKHPVTR